ncbi:MAG TPA: hypothetical protein PLX45_20505 [Piscinibacter sp.]|jgi:hypothetical protein|nr:hypothetical protein [Piscinibacter sp.]HPG77219.1 hypothetical protein [Piscinibacter sp.]HPM68657.1 hypothetical protein [Piscinibacter sp.]
MKALINAEVAIQAAVSAAQSYADIVTDRDPDDGEHVVPGELRRFLARLRLLHGVPFSYLVPDAKLLPIESIRFFYIDRAWTDALVQGALSVGTISSADRTQLEAVYPHIRAEVDEAERSIRQPKGEELLKAGSGTITGFILRSRAVSGWPNLHVRAYSRDVVADDALTTAAESDPSRMKVLRMERLAPAVLLVLFDGVPAVVHIEEPRQGIQFGVRIDPDGPPNERRVKVRDCNTGNPVPPEKAFTPTNSVPVPFRPNAPGVLNMAALRTRLATKAPNSGGTLEPNEYALQMLRFPFRQVFGDPDNQTESERFYALDEFKAKVALTTWKSTVATSLAKVNP